LERKRQELSLGLEHLYHAFVDAEDIATAGNVFDQQFRDKLIAQCIAQALDSGGACRFASI
jgi:hypothetical protein